MKVTNLFGPRDRPEKPPARLCLDPGRSRDGMLDGGWWPRTRDPVAELTALVTALNSEAGRVFRIGLSDSGWDSHPPRIVTHGQVVKLGWFGPTDVHAVAVSGDFHHPLELLVIPSSASAAKAQAAMEMASNPSNGASATEILALHDIATGPDPGPGPHPVHGAQPGPHPEHGAQPGPHPLLQVHHGRVTHRAPGVNGTTLHSVGGPGTADGGPS